MISDFPNKNPDVFLDKEIEIRKKNNLPPFQRFISLILTGENEIKLEKEAIKLKLFLQNKKNPGKPFPLPNDVSKWENATENERKTAEPGVVLPPILGFSKERMKKLGFETDAEWSHLDAIWYLNSRISKCLQAIEKIKTCRGIAKPTKKAIQKAQPIIVVILLMFSRRPSVIYIFI